MTLTFAGCGMGPYIAQQAEWRIAELDAVEDVNVELTFDPPWTPDMITEDGKKLLGSRLAAEKPAVFPQRPRARRRARAARRQHGRRRAPPSSERATGEPPMNPQQQAQARAKVEAMRRQFEQKRAIAETLSKIGRKIGVYSGKGGVGKTTVAVNLAVTLANDGASVGLLDVDIDCPNVIRAMKVAEPPTVGEGRRMIPPERFGVKVMSMGFFQENEEEAIIWRGPMIHNAINQLLQSTDWGTLDYLIIDLPPGTSDAPLTVMQSLEMDGFVVVTTPQELAKIDAIRSVNMIRKLRIDVLGVVENFTGEIFGGGAGAELAEHLGIPYLGSIGMRADYRDTSKPAALRSKPILKEYRAIAANFGDALERLG